MNEIESTVSSQSPQTPVAPSRAARPPAAVKWIIAAFFCVATLVQFIVLLDFGPDEPNHIDYAYSLAVQHHLPIPQSDRVKPKPGENHLVQHPPLYYAALGVIWKLSGALQRPLDRQLGIVSFDKYTPQEILARRLMRLTSALLGCLTLWLIASTLAVLGIPARWQMLLVALAASWPMLQYVSGVVNNENLAYAFSALFCYALIRQWKIGSCTPKQAFGLGLLCGAGLLIKQSTLFALPIALWILWIIAEPRQRINLFSRFSIGLLLTGIWWPLHNILAHGEPFPTFTPNPTQPSLLEIFTKWHQLFHDWIPLLLNSSFLPDWSLYFVDVRFEGALVFGIILVALLLLLYGRFVSQNPRWRQLRALSFTASVLLLLGVLQYCFFKDQRAHIGGRYLLNALPWATVFFAACLPLLQKDNLEKLPAKLPTVAMLPLGFLLVVDFAWWFLAWTYYGTQIATELQRRAGG